MKNQKNNSYNTISEKMKTTKIPLLLLVLFTGFYGQTNSMEIEEWLEPMDTICPTPFIDNLPDEVYICPDTGTIVSVTEDWFSQTWSDGSMGDSLLIERVGTYTFTAQDSAGCIFQETIIADTILPTVTLDSVICLNSLPIVFPINPNFTTVFVNGQEASELSAEQVTTAAFNEIVFRNNVGQACFFADTQLVFISENPIVAFIDPIQNFCSNDPAYQFQATPLAGIFEGTAGLSVDLNTGLFYPDSSTVGNHVLYYVFQQNGCLLFTSLAIHIDSVPSVVIDLPTTFCINDPLVPLIANPTGGVFKINGTDAIDFSPMQLGIGNHMVVYEYPVPNTSCTSTTSLMVNVQDTTAIEFFNFAQSYCQEDTMVLLQVEPMEGVFRINGNIVSDTLDASDYPAGPYILSYEYTEGVCTSMAYIDFKINAKVVSFITNLPDQVCETTTPFELNSSPAGGVYVAQDYLAPDGLFTPSNVTIPSSVIVEYNYTDPNTGCSGNSMTMVDIAFPIEIDLTLDEQIQSELSVFCSNDDNNYSLNATPGIGTFQSNDIALTTIGNTTYFNPTLASDNIVSILYTLNDICNSQTSIQAEVVAPSENVVFVGFPSEICHNVDSILLQGSPPQGVFSGPGVNGNYFYPSEAGDPGIKELFYAITDQYSCDVLISATIKVLPVTPPFILNLPDSICSASDPFQIIVSPGPGIFSGNGTYISSTGWFDPSLAPVNTAVGVSYSYTNGAGCEESITKTIFINENPTVSFFIEPSIGTTADVYCFNDETDYALVGNPSGGQFSGDGVVQIGVNYVFRPSVSDPISETIFIQYEYEDAAACSTIGEQQIKVVAPALSEISGLVPQICEDATPIALLGTPTAGQFSVNGIPLLNNEFDPTQFEVAMHHLVLYEAADNNGCLVATTENIEVVPLPMIQLSLVDDEYCQNSGPIELSAVPEGGSFQETSGVVDDQFYPNLVDPDSYPIIYNYNLEFCSNTDSFFIKVLETPPVNIINQELTHCLSDGAVSIEVDRLGGQFFVDNVEVEQFIPSEVGIGGHLVQYTFENSNECISTDVEVFNVIAAPNANFTSIYECEPNTLTFRDLSFGVSDLECEWTFDNMIIDESKEPTHTFTAAGQTAVSLQVTDENGCFAISDKLIEVPQQNKTAMLLSDTILIVGDTLYAEATASVELFNYLWTFEPGRTASDSKSSHVFTRADVYDVQLQSTDIYGCQDLITKKVFVQNELDISFEVLNVYPNPTSGIVNIELYLPESVTLKVELVNLLGQVVDNFFFGNHLNPLNRGIRTVELELDGLINGIYFIRIFKDGEFISGPINFETGNLSNEKLKYQKYLKFFYFKD